MADLTLRNVKGTPLTNQELDDNFSNLNTEVGTKADDTATTAALANKVETSVMVDGRLVSGFLDRTNVLSFDDGTRTFSMAGSFDYYIDGVKYSDADLSVQIDDINGLHFIYYSNSNVLTNTTTPWSFSMDFAPIAVVFWDGVKGRIGEERHAASRNIDWHGWAHTTVGTKYESGLGLTANNTTFTVAPGIIHDEDIEITIPQTTSCVLVYRNGAASVVEDSPTLYYKLNGAIPQYDNNGTLTNVTNNYYMCVYFYATNDIDSPIYVVLGQAQYQQLAPAESESPTSLVIPTLPTAEFKLLYKVIIRYQGGAANYIDTFDYRTLSSLPGGNVSPSDHNGLLSLQGGSVTERYHLTEAEYNAVIALITP
jgi:hypothetical protein